MFSTWYIWGQVKTCKLPVGQGSGVHLCLLDPITDLKQPQMNRSVKTKQFCDVWAIWWKPGWATGIIVESIHLSWPIYQPVSWCIYRCIQSFCSMRIFGVEKSHETGYMLLSFSMSVSAGVNACVWFICLCAGTCMSMSKGNCHCISKSVKNTSTKMSYNHPYQTKLYMRPGCLPNITLAWNQIKKHTETHAHTHTHIYCSQEIA